MKNNKLALVKTYYSSVHSAELQPQLESYMESRKLRYSPQKSAIITCDNPNRIRRLTAPEGLLGQNKGVFSLDRLNFQKFKQQRDLLQSSKLPSFNIKKLVDKSLKRRMQSRLREQSSEQMNLDKKTGISKQSLKRYWDKYINAEMMSNELSKQTVSINKTVGLVSNRPKKNKSEIKKSKEEEADLKVDSHERTTFYVNNFIKTRYRRRRIDISTKVQKQLSFREKKKEEVVKREESQDKLEGNWMVPWDKANDAGEEQFFMGL